MVAVWGIWPSDCQKVERSLSNKQETPDETLHEDSQTERWEVGTSRTENEEYEGRESVKEISKKERVYGKGQESKRAQGESDESNEAGSFTLETGRGWVTEDMEKEKRMELREITGCRVARG